MRKLFDHTGPGLKAGPLLGLLTLASIVYGGICRLRLLLYRLGLFRTRQLNALVISIGNLTVGGTGKTPLVIALAGYLRRRGLKVGVLSRGYKGRRLQDLQWVSDGQKLLASSEEVGEEPCLIASRLNGPALSHGSPQIEGVPVVVGKNRYRSGQSLLERFKLDAIFLDDGFQHLGLHRDIDLLLIDGTQPFGPPQSAGKLLPRGILRESLLGIRRASAILVTRMEQCRQGQEVIRQVRHYNPQAPVFQVFSRPTVLIELVSGQERDAVSLKGQSVLAFSGIGNPASFRFFLERLGAKIVAEVVFEDHHRYTLQDMKRLAQDAREEFADLLVTTEKDGVKIREFLGQGQAPDFARTLWALRIDLERIEDSQAWERFISGHVKIS
jgi:tetraacyldisaccharide 4'-kinase